MAIDTLRYGSRGGGDAGRAAKERREKIALAIGGTILVGLLALEGPKTLARLQGHGAGAVTPPAAASTASATGAADRASRALYPALGRFAAKDLFAAAPGQGGATAQVLAVPAAPSVRRSGFVAKDPFVAQVGQSAGTGEVPLTEPTPPAVRTSEFVAKDPFVGGFTAPVSTPAPPPPPAPAPRQKSTPPPAVPAPFIVMLASVPLSRGRPEAERAAATARLRGLRNVRIVVSSDHRTLRDGFYAVFTGPYSTFAATAQAVRRARIHGYVGAYTRRLFG
jgi:hypothetical protein